MKEIDETTDDNKPNEIEKDNTEKTTIQHVLREIKTVVEKHLNKAEQNVKSKKGKSIIKKVECSNEDPVFWRIGQKEMSHGRMW